MLNKTFFVFLCFTDEQKPISWEDPLPQIARSNSVSSPANNNFNPQSIIRKSSNSIITLPNRLHHNSYTLSNLNNNQEQSFYNSQASQQFDLHLHHHNHNHPEEELDENEDLLTNDKSPLLNIKNLLNNNHIINTNSNSPKIKHHKKLEHTPSARTVSSEDSWCSSIGDKCNNLDDHHDCCTDDTSSFNDDEDNISERSSSLASTPRNSQLRLTFNKAKQHLSFDKWRNSSNNSHNSSLNSLGNATMPSTTTTATNNSHNSSNNSTQESPGEPLSRLSRWFSIRRGSHQYDLNGSGRSGSVEKSFENDDKNSIGKKMPQLQEVRFFK
jgi:hypothetical protein